MEGEDRQCTISRSGRISGIGLHSGCSVSLTLRPAPPNHGLIFQRSDLPGTPTVIVDVDNAVPAVRHTLLSSGGCQILTPEHVLSALYGLGIDNALIEMDASEPPICDGSSRPFVHLIMDCGVVRQDILRRRLSVKQMIRLKMANETEYIVLPQSKGLRITCVYEDHIGPILQHESIDLTRITYESKVCGARTFVWYRDVKPLLDQGLIKGGSLDSAVVLGMEDTTAKFSLENVQWRCSNEIVTHKILDLVGDLAMLARPLNAHIIAIRPGHTANGMLVRALRKELRTRASVL